jgi:hypothetical protein
MQIFSMAVLVLTCIGVNIPFATAQQPDACKECREFRRACLTAHSQAACKIDYDICMKHCTRK